MDAPRQPDGPPIRDGKPYSRIAHLAEDWCARSSPSARVLREAGLSAPEVLADGPRQRAAAGRGPRRPRVRRARWRAARSQAELWRGRGRRARSRCARVPVPPALPLPDGSELHAAAPRPRRLRRSRSSCCSTGIGRRCKGEPVPRERARRVRWRCGRRCSTACSALPGGWFLRDFHSPNLIWLPEREGHRPRRHHRFPGCAQRALPPSTWSPCCRMRASMCRRRWRRELLAHYCARDRQARAGLRSRRRSRSPMPRSAPSATPRSSASSRGCCSATASRSISQHIPRIWGYLERNLRDPRLARAGGVVRPALPADVRGGDAAG